MRRRKQDQHPYKRLVISISSQKLVDEFEIVFFFKLFLFALISVTTLIVEIIKITIDKNFF